MIDRDKIETRDLREARPCDGCGDAFGIGPFYVLTTRLACIDRQTALGFFGLNAVFGGLAPELALAMGPTSDGIRIAKATKQHEVWVCGNCYAGKPLAVIEEIKADREWRQQEPKS